jgi:hypothetical protein
MRVIIEVEDGGADGPEVVLRSSRAGTQTRQTRQTMQANVTGPGADLVTGAIDAGPAPQRDASGSVEGPVTTPATSPVFDRATSQSAGAAPGAPTEG